MAHNDKRRKVTRLSYWNYGWPGWYFLTLCAYDRRCLFGDVVDGSVLLSLSGRIALDALEQSAALRSELALDCWVVMPNHIHLICVLGTPDTRTIGYFRPPGTAEARSASSFVNGCKSSVTSQLKQLGLAVDGEVWQRGFNDHIIRSESALVAIRQYIANNPRQWELDRMHPSAARDAPDELDLLLEADSRIAFGK